jgi:hypothetical protein
LGKIGKSCGFDADRERADPDRPVGRDEIEIAAVQTTFPREIPAKIESVVTSLEANEIVIADRWNQSLVVRQSRQYFRRWARM